MPSFDTVHSLTHPVQTERMQVDDNQDLLINSVSRCGPSFVEAEGLYNHVAFELGECRTGFSCCTIPETELRKQSSNLTALVAAHCKCPKLATGVHLSVYDGAFADSCRVPVSSYPKCVRECSLDSGVAITYTIEKIRSVYCALLDPK